MEQAMEKEAVQPGRPGEGGPGRDEQDASGEQPATQQCRHGTQRLLVHVIVLETLLGGALAANPATSELAPHMQVRDSTIA